MLEVQILSGVPKFASADGAVPGLLNQVMGVRISPEAPVYVGG